MFCVRYRSCPVWGNPLTFAAEDIKCAHLMPLTFILNIANIHRTNPLIKMAIHAFPPVTPFQFRMVLGIPAPHLVDKLLQLLALLSQGIGSPYRDFRSAEHTSELQSQ